MGIELPKKVAGPYQEGNYLRSSFNASKDSEKNTMTASLRNNVMNKSRSNLRIMLGDLGRLEND